MRLLKTHPHTSHGLDMEPRKREEKNLKETQTLKQGIPPIKMLPRIASVAGGGRKGSRTCRIPPVWRGGGAERLYGEPTTEKGFILRRALVVKEENMGANTREKAYKKSLACHWYGGGFDEETTNTLDKRWHHLQPREGVKGFSRKNNVEQIQHTRKNKR